MESVSVTIKDTNGTTVFTPRPSSPAHVFHVEDPNWGCVIESGAVDLFLVPLEPGMPPGARTHVLRVEEGEPIFGVGRFPVDRFKVIAIPSPHTRCRFFRVDDAASNPDLEQLMESWILALSAAAADDPPSGILEIARPGRLLVAEEAKAVLVRKGLLWARQTEGVSYLMGQSICPLHPGATLVPITRQGWLQMEAGSRIECLEAQAAAGHCDQKTEGLRHFHAAIAMVLAVKRDRLLNKEQAQLEAKRVSDVSRMNSSLYQLGSTLESSLGRGVVDHTYTDPLLWACDLVGKAGGIRLRPHADMLRGVKIADPVNAIARASGVRVRRVALRGDWWKHNNGNLLGFCDSDNAPVAIIQKATRGYRVHFKSTEAAKELTQEIAQTLNPFAYLFYRPFPTKVMKLPDIIRFGLFSTKRELWLIVCMGIAAGLMGVIPPYATSIVFNDLIPGAQKSQLLQMAGFLVAIALSTSLFSLTRSFALLRVEGKMDVAIQAALWDRLLRLPASFFRNYSSGDLAQRSLGVAQIRRTLTGSTLMAIFSSIFSVFSFGLLFYYSWQLALLATFLVAVACGVSLLMGWVQTGPQRELFELRGRISGLLLQLITGVAKFRVAAAENRAFMVWSRAFARQKLLYKRIRIPTNALTTFNAVYPVACLGVIFLFNAQMMRKPHSKPLNTGDFIGFLSAFTQFLTTTLLVSESVIAAMSVVPLYQRAKPIFETLPEVDDARSDPGVLSGEIEISNVSFRYREDMPLVLKDISISIKPGQFVAFVGVSGSGKSTLFRLLLGFESPASGAIYYDGHDLSGLDVQAVRRQLGVVLQTSRLISGDIFTNIVGSSSLTIDDAWHAARLAGLEADIKRMPMGMHTIIGEGGGGISGGQRQRLMIARAIVSKPRILIFDEATSALDNETQAIVSRSLEGLQATRIVIAHRLSTIVNADRIYVMGNGVVQQSGTYDELLQQGGLFGDLVKRQLA